MLVNLPALFLSALSSPPPGSPPSLGSLCPSAEEEAASAGRQLQLEPLSAGDWACCPPLAPQALFPSTFLRLAPDDASLPASLHPPRLPRFSVSPHHHHPGAPQGVRWSERPSVARGPALVPRLYFEEKLTGAPFRRRPRCDCCRH